MSISDFMDEKELLKFCEAYGESGYAIAQGIKLNPDKKRVNEVIKGLLANEKKHGFRYCPCRVIVGKKDEDAPKICPCQWHIEEIQKKWGHCLCNLFVKR